MVCLCKDVLEALQSPALMAPPPAPAASRAAGAALALAEQLTQALPDVPPPEAAFDDPEQAERAVQARQAVEGVEITSITTLLTWVQTMLQARTVLDVDLTEARGTKALARLAGTLNERVKSISGLPLDFEPWQQLATVHRTTETLQQVFDTLDLGADEAEAPGQAQRPDSLTALPSPAAWGGQPALAIAVLHRQLQQMQVKFNQDFIQTLSRTALQVTQAVQEALFDTGAAAPLVLGMSAIRSLRDGLGVNPLQTDPAELKRMLAERFRRMTAAAERHGVRLTDPGDLPQLAAIPGLQPKIIRMLEWRLLLSARVSRMLSFDVTLPPAAGAAGAVLAASLAGDLARALDAPLLRAAPCSGCDLRVVMQAAAAAAAHATAAGATQAMLFARRLGPAAEAAAAAEIGLAGLGSAAAENVSQGKDGDSAGDSAGDGGSGAQGAGAGGGGGGGGVPATVMTAQLMCTFGVAPSPLTVLPINRTSCSDLVAANIMDHVPLVNIMPFGMCTTVSNPTVAAATAAAFGVLTPMPCIPATATPWTPGATTVLLGKMPMLHQTSMCNCMWGGIIQIVEPGQMPTLLSAGGASAGGVAAAVAAAKAAAAAKASAAAAAGAAAKEKQQEEEAAAAAAKT